MKKTIFALSAAMAIAAPLPALAQGMPVHDSANLLQQINAVRQAIQVVAQGKAQIAEAQKLYQDLNKLTDIPRLAQQLKTDALRQLDTSSTSLQGFGSGDLNVVGAARGKADAVYRGFNTCVEQLDNHHQDDRTGQQSHLYPAAAEPESGRNQHQ